MKQFRKWEIQAIHLHEAETSVPLRFFFKFRAQRFATILNAHHLEIRNGQKRSLLYFPGLRQR